MLVGVAYGQMTPGCSTREADEFERRIQQRYVDFIAGAGWDYLGNYLVEGREPGAFAEIYTSDATSAADAQARDSENERDLARDIADIYDECRRLFWQRGSLRWWHAWPGAMALPKRGGALTITVAERDHDGALPALAWSGDGPAPIPAAVLVSEGATQPAAVDGEPLAPDTPPLSLDLPVGTVLRLRPLSVAPDRSVPE